MAYLFRKQRTRELPTDAEIVTRKGQRLAVWADSKGRKHTDAISETADGTLRLLVESATWYARFRDHNGHVITRNT